MPPEFCWEVREREQDSQMEPDCQDWSLKTKIAIDADLVKMHKVFGVLNPATVGF